MADTDARLKVQKDEYEEKIAGYYNECVRLETELTAANDTITKITTAKDDLQKELDEKVREVGTAAHDAENLAKSVTAQAAAKVEYDRELQDLKDRHTHLDELYQVAESAATEAEAELKIAQEERDEALATIAGLREEFETKEKLLTDTSTLAEQHELAQSQLEKVIGVFQKEFRQLADGVSIDDYLRQFSQTIQSHRHMRRDDSQASLHEFISQASARRPAGGNRQVSTASLGDELHGHDSQSQSETESGNEDEVEDDDPTLTLDGDTDDLPEQPSVFTNVPGSAWTDVRDSLFGEVHTATQTPDETEWLRSPAAALKSDLVSRGVYTEEVIPEPAELQRQTAELGNLQALLKSAKDLAEERQKDKKAQFDRAREQSKQLAKMKQENEALKNTPGGPPSAPDPAVIQHQIREAMADANDLIQKLRDENAVQRRQILLMQQAATGGSNVAPPTSAREWIFKLENQLKAKQTRIEELEKAPLPAVPGPATKAQPQASEKIVQLEAQVKAQEIKIEELKKSPEPAASVVAAPAAEAQPQPAASNQVSRLVEEVKTLKTKIKEMEQTPAPAAPAPEAQPEATQQIAELQAQIEAQTLKIEELEITPRPDAPSKANEEITKLENKVMAQRFQIEELQRGPVPPTYTIEFIKQLESGLSDADFELRELRLLTKKLKPRTLAELEAESKEEMRLETAEAALVVAAEKAQEQQERIQELEKQLEAYKKRAALTKGLEGELEGYNKKAASRKELERELQEYRKRVVAIAAADGVEIRWRDRLPVVQWKIRSPRTLQEWYSCIPTWMLIALAALVAGFAAVTMQVMSQRAMWLGANDLRHQELLTMTGGYGMHYGICESLWYGWGEMMGAERSMIG
ncbi:hypothetical protein LTR62_008776 [Meristemomyces frigidus]|uniref:Uncharacterized protein n=1 Tax=Meristemomyces frigidus TaxID=1508187 RepID=A0AAN7T958_9PEZI|nr:hypothetical protein LTR62_008776 [Meristemomyces frigidus]